MAKKYKPSEAELVNDPSLRWNDYKWGEVLEIVGLTGLVRFIRRDHEDIYVGSMTLAERPIPYHRLSVRRPVYQPKPLSQDDKVSIVAGAHATFGTRHLPSKKNPE